MSRYATYAPFDGKGGEQIAAAPFCLMPRTQPMAVSNANARRIIDAMKRNGASMHGPQAHTLWVPLMWLQHNGHGYTLQAQPEAGYKVVLDHIRKEGDAQ